MLHYPSGFYFEMAYQLGKRNLVTFQEMQSNAIRVEANLLAKKEKMKTQKTLVFKEESSSSPDLKFDVMLKTVENLVDKLTPSRVESQP